MLDVLAAALAQSTQPTCVTTAQLDSPGPEIIYANDAYLTLMSAERSEIIGRTPRIMQGPLTERFVLDFLRRSLEAGASFTGETYNYRLDGVPFINHWRIDPIRDETGEVTYFAGAQRDVTAVRTLEAAREAGRVIDRSLRAALEQVDEPAEAMAELGVSLCEAVQLVTFGFGTSQVKITHPFGNRVVRGPELDAAIEFDFGTADGRATAEVSVHLSEEEAVMVDDDSFEVVIRRGTGALERLMSATIDRRMVAEFERQLGSRDLPNIAGFEIAVRYEPVFGSLEISGDWLDVIPFPSGTCFVIGDVAGHGVEAAVAMTRLRSVVEVRLAENDPLSAQMVDLNRFCTQHDIFSTLLVVKATDTEFEIASAGHLPPILRQAGTCRITDPGPGPALGSVEADGYRTVTVERHVGTVIAMFTDGLVETRAETIDAGLHHVRSLVEGHSGALEHLASSLMDAVGDGSIPDDASLMLIEVTG